MDRLALNWQRLILTHLEEREHPGVLTGSPITDMKITVAAGRAHDKHTEGGDFRQATYRAVRNGLMFAENVLLEPWYRFTLAVPAAAVGRAMTDLDGEPIAPPEVRVLGEDRLLVTIHEGKYHQVKRMIAAVGGEVTFLRRISIGALRLDPALAEGEVRELSPEECFALLGKAGEGQ